MTKEEKFVVNPLEEYFKKYKRSGANWSIKNKPKYGTSATGWDLQMERKNQVLLIEAKYIRGQAASAFAGLMMSPIINRPEKMKRDLYRSRYATICWAIGCGYNKAGRDKKYKMSGIYQILFDYFARNTKFWKSYSKILHVKYIFFVDKQMVAKISFDKVVGLSNQYDFLLNEKSSLHEKRIIAEKLLKNLEFK